MANLNGEYIFSNSTLLKEGEHPTKLLLSARKDISPLKPKLFLLEVLPNGKRRYVSSLFQTPQWSENGPQTYSFDDRGKDYLLTLDRPHQKGVIVEAPNDLKGGVGVEIP
jgi:hypothetical protein